MIWGMNYIRSIPNFSSAQNVLEIGAGNFVRSQKLADTYPSKTFYATDYDMVGKKIDHLVKPNLKIQWCDAENMYFRDNYFDVIFSIAVMEHFSDTKAVLLESFRCLAPGGYYYFIQAPFWSCSMGHHYKQKNDKIRQKIPLYGHLYLTKDEMCSELKKANADFNIDDCVNRIYDRLDLSRLTRNSVFSLCSSLPFEIVKWEDYDDEFFDEDKAKYVSSVSPIQLDVDEMKVKGARVLLRKPWNCTKSY